MGWDVQDVVRWTRAMPPATPGRGRYDEIAAIRVGAATPRIPLAMASVQADGGIVSTLADALAFMDAFFGGRLFPARPLEEIQADWHRVFFPLEYGTGIMDSACQRS